MSHYKTPKEKAYKKIAYDEMAKFQNRDAAAAFRAKPYYAAAKKKVTVFEHIIESPERLAEFIFRYQRTFKSSSEVLQILNKLEDT